MEERYEIRGKIGQGGLGAVYRGYDTRMSREVAIKRISASGDDSAIQEESTRQLVKEASALASLQHPHIVTVYDVGSDEDGPYVVMELISGKTLDELIEHAPLTWPDFRELAMQTQEALIAAQEVNLIHSDLKPSNIMLTWLPSGKFQIKIVDFGLSTLAQSQTKEELDALEAVFGSIFFMAPEQFERVPLDSRSDAYSMGCVYYQALTGIYPFGGETGNDVMAAHLNHLVTPIQEIRSDIPMWACDWIMWQINRMPGDRPESARQCLSVFLQNDKIPNPTMSLGKAQASAAKPQRPVFPGSKPAHVPAQAGKSTSAQAARATPTQQGKSSNAAQTTSVTTTVATAAATTPTAPFKPVRRNAFVSVAAPATLEPPAAAMANLPLDSVEIAESAKTKSAPQPLIPPVGSKPSVHSTALDVPEPEPAPVVAAHAIAVKPTRPAAAAASPAAIAAAAAALAATAEAAAIAAAAAAAAKAKKQKEIANAIQIMVATVVALLIIFIIWAVMKRS